MSALLLLVCAGYRGESLLGIARIHSAGVSDGGTRERTEADAAGSYLLAAAHPGRGLGDALLVPVANERGIDARGSAGVADSARDSLERCHADDPADGGCRASEARSARGEANA